MNWIRFLDIKLTRTTDTNLITNWYQKSTNSGRYFNYYSYHLLGLKIGTIINLTDSAILLLDKKFRTTISSSYQNINR